MRQWYARAIAGRGGGGGLGDPSDLLEFKPRLGLGGEDKALLPFRRWLRGGELGRCWEESRRLGRPSLG